MMIKHELINLDDGVPVSCTFVRTDSNQAVVGFSSSSSVLYDIETGQQIVRFTPPSDTPGESGWCCLKLSSAVESLHLQLVGMLQPGRLFPLE